MLGPVGIQRIELAWRGPFVLARLQQRLQAIAPQDVQADDVVLLFAKAQRDEARVQFGITAHADGDAPQQ